MDITKIPASVRRKLGYYVYMYVHPKTNEVLYVGKGKGNRVLTHIKGSHNSEHAKAVDAIKKAGLKPKIEYLVHGLKDEQTAKIVEAAVIDAIGLDQLTNDVAGYHSRRQGRMLLEQVIGLYGQKPANIKEPVILIRINKMFRHGMSESELYDVTRCAWKLGPRRENAKYAMAVYQGVVREVYEVMAWLPGGSTFNYRWPQGMGRSDRWEFVGIVAPDAIRKKYVNRSVIEKFSQGSQNPVVYVNC